LNNGSIVGISAYNSMYIIEKSDEAFGPYCGNIVISGNNAEIEPRAVPFP